MNVLKAKGVLVYDPDRTINKWKGKKVNGHKRVDMPWLVCNTSDSISAYYRWWAEKEILNPLKLDKGIKLQPPMWGVHASILHGREHIPEDKQHLWGKYDGEVIEFEYSPFVTNTWKFFNVPVRSKMFEEIRTELGLPGVDPRHNVVLEGFNFHITIGRLI